MKHLLSTFVFCCLSSLLQAQELEMADKMRADGKIYVVVAVLLAIFIGLFVYLISIDRKLSKLEKDTKK
jgi:CcmD family protein